MSNPTTTPTPASPLPWSWGIDKRGYHIRSHIGDYIYREEPYEGGSFTGEVFFDYIIWAANNAPALAERVAELEARLMPAGNGTDYLDHYKARVETLEAALQSAIAEIETQFRRRFVAPEAAELMDRCKALTLAKKALETK